MKFYSLPIILIVFLLVITTVTESCGDVEEPSSNESIRSEEEDSCTCDKPPLCEDNEVYSNCTNGGCDARNCSQLGRPVPCIKLDPASCKKGCVCKTGYLRADNGTCIPSDQCPSPCKGNEVYSSCANGICSPQECKDRGIFIPCPPMVPGSCIGGCVCPDKYLRKDGVCVPEEECGVGGTCPADQEYSACPDTLCDPLTCDEVGVSKPNCGYKPTCPGKPACICKNPKVKNKDGKCIAQNECPPKCQKNEEYSNCSNQICGHQNCTQYGYPIPFCPWFNISNCEGGCICKNNYLRNPYGVCVPQDQCPKYLCSDNEVYSNCTNGGCDARNCSQLGRPVPCVRLDPAYCKRGCVCKTGYLRADNGTCVPKDECRNTCGKNERLVKCPETLCIPLSCKQVGRPVPCPIVGPDGPCNKPAECICIDGYLRNNKGVCVPYQQCSKPKEHEVWSPCGDFGCEKRNCTQIDQPDICIDPIKCVGGYVCETGYLRARNGTCIPRCRCYDDLCSKPNEYYDPCPSSCPARTCGIDDRLVRCAAPLKPGDPDCPQPACRCKSGYFRDKKGNCVLWEQCQTPTCPCSEVYNKCPPIKCDAEYCPKNRDSPQTCVSPKNCSQGRCVCGFNQKRDRKTGKCIPISKCPPFQCNKPNEVYESCPPVCPGQTCDDYLKNATCPKYHIGIVVPCEPACRCKEGYYRDSKGNCVTGQKCKDETKCGCSQTPQQPSNNTCADVENLRSALIQGNNLLAMNLLRQEMMENPDKSTISCAYLVMATLAQLALRSNGTTLNELLKIQNLQNKEQIRCAYKGFSERFQTTGDTELDLAYKIYVSSQYNLSNSFQKDAVDLFDSEVGSVDFNQNVEAANEINKWVSDKTKGKIEDLVSPAMFDSYTRLVLTNAAYFKGTWKTAFDNETKPTDFHVNPNKTIKVDMMHLRTKMGYSDSEELNSKIVELDFNYGNVTLILIVPNDLYGLSAVLDKMVENPTLLNTALNNIYTETVTLYLPKSDISSSIDLKRVMKSIGVNKIFDADAKLSGMIEPNQDLYVSDFVMKATSSINQTGAVAAAASAAVVGLTAVHTDPVPIIVTADHPHGFCYKVRDVLIFCGIKCD